MEELRCFVDELSAQTHESLGETMYARLHWVVWAESMFRDGQADSSRELVGPTFVGTLDEASFVKATTDPRGF